METRKQFHYNKKWNRLIACILYPVILELIFHWIVFPKSPDSVAYLMYFAAFIGLCFYFVTGLFWPVINRILFYVFVAVAWIYFAVQLIYQYVFRVFFSFASLFAVGGDVLEFRRQIFNAVVANLGYLLLLLLPLVSAVLSSVWLFGFERETWKHSLASAGSACVLYAGFHLLLLQGGTEEFSPYDLYKNDWMEEFGAERLGLFITAGKDIKGLGFGEKRAEAGEEIVIITRTPKPSVVTPEPGPSATPTNPPAEALTPMLTMTPTPSPSPTPTPIDTSPNVLDYDFTALAAAETNKQIKTLHEYFANEEYTRKNEYTGMFEGYNLIYITAEGFSPYAIVDGLTPTLKKLTETGFVFSNYYSPIWGTSTIDGEFINCTGLLPDKTYSLRRMIGHDMRFCFGHMFSELGYLTNAYHNHSDTYYNRDKTHPSMGYDYKGRQGIGISKVNGKYTWPESDLEMMELTIPEYIEKEPFHVYYMTVSGHLEYTFHDNRMAYNNRKYVEDLPYSDIAKAYIACNYELEKALTYLIEQLEEAGIAERTVIALATDHYPYGLEKKYIDELAGHEVEENFELYKSTLILWSASMKEPVEVNKYCSALDIMPTLANLFGLEYDSRLYMGKDILSDSEGLVMFKNKSFITDKIMYNSRTKEITYLTDEEVTEDYVAAIRQIVKNRFAVSKDIIDLDYYHYLPVFPVKKEEPEQE